MLSRSRSPLQPPKARKPLRRVGKVHKTVRLAGPEITALRQTAYLRARGMCELNLPGCQRFTPWLYGHLVHKRSRGAGGSDTEENTLWGCAGCHAKSHNAGGKPCPKKV